jgi:hypothetical protein
VAFREFEYVLGKDHQLIAIMRRHASGLLEISDEFARWLARMVSAFGDGVAQFGDAIRTRFDPGRALVGLEP